MQARALEPSPSALALLPGASFADAFSVDVDEAGLDAETAARRSLGGGGPGWMRWLLWLRDGIVGPLGLKRTDRAGATAADRIGVFPCLSRSPDRVVLGFDDAHLDFRISIDTAKSSETSTRVVATTVVKPHNLLGRAYLRAVMPFHKLIVPTMLARVELQP